jgi:putative FmdB family regulatory protein
MPRYDYRCTQCGHRFEARHGIADDAPDCPNCGTPKPARLITTAPTLAQGMNANAGDGRTASKEQLRAKWAEETPKLRQKLEKKLGEDTVRRNAPSLYQDSTPKKPAE